MAPRKGKKKLLIKTVEMCGYLENIFHRIFLKPHSEIHMIFFIFANDNTDIFIYLGIPHLHGVAKRKS